MFPLLGQYIQLDEGPRVHQPVDSFPGQKFAPGVLFLGHFLAPATHPAPSICWSLALSSFT